MGENTSYENKETGGKEEYDDNINENTHVKPVDNWEKLHLNSEIETDASDR